MFDEYWLNGSWAIINARFIKVSPNDLDLLDQGHPKLLLQFSLIFDHYASFEENWPNDTQGTNTRFHIVTKMTLNL
jgi:hypothetical protein